LLLYSKNHQRELHLWDVRNTSAPSFEFSIDIGNNVLTPYLDSDTGMLFLAGKVINFKNKDKFLIS
jgi:hypothetical protein